VAEEGRLKEILRRVVSIRIIFIIGVRVGIV